MKSFIYLFLFFIVIGCGTSTPDVNENLSNEVQTYLDGYNQKFQELLIVSAEAAWTLNTKIVEGDTTAGYKAQVADEAMAAYTGSKENIETAQKYLAQKNQLSPLQIKQLETILYMAGSNPETAGELVSKRIKAENAQTENLFGFDTQINGKSVSGNDINDILKNSTDLSERLQAWEASKEVGKELKEGLANLQRLRNQTVQNLNYENYFHYQVSEYGMTSEEMMTVCQGMVDEVWEMYREIHTWARYRLAEKYNQPVPDMIPAHWLPNKWGQDFAGLVKVEAMNLDPILEEKSAEWIVTEGEKFYVSMGFPKLPQSFYEKSSLYPLPDSADYKKNSHASAWHMDNDKDVRSLMSIVPNTEWWGTTLHELGHIYYYMTYTNGDVPVILRGGANRAYHEAMGTQMGLASMQRPFLQHVGLLPQDMPKPSEEEKIMGLLNEALDYIVFIPWSAGVMTEFEHELYANNLPIDQYNKKWWELKRKYQGIVPPAERGEEFCDAASKTHINNDAAQYYDYAMSNVLLFQFHDHIARTILHQDPHATNYHGNREVGDFVKKLMYPGATVDWREHLKNNIGSDMSAKAMVDYFAPLMDHLKKENEGREYTL